MQSIVEGSLYALTWSTTVDSKKKIIQQCITTLKRVNHQGTYDDMNTTIAEDQHLAFPLLILQPATWQAMPTTALGAGTELRCLSCITLMLTMLSSTEVASSRGISRKLNIRRFWRQDEMSSHPRTVFVARGQCEDFILVLHT
jgi:hypothetical protein